MTLDEFFFPLMREAIKMLNEDEKEDVKSYVRKCYDEWCDGKHVAHEEKEYENGKLVKDESFDKKLRDDKANVADAPKLPSAAELMREKSELEKKLARVETEMEKVRKVNDELSADNIKLRNKLNAIEDLFNC